MNVSKLASKRVQALSKDRQFLDWRKKSRQFYSYLLIPALVLLTLITIVPFLYIIITSLTGWDMTRPGSFQFIGLRNYTNLFVKDTRFWNSILVQIRLTLYTVPFEMLIGLAVALYLKHNFKANWIIAISRSIFLIPMVIPPIVAAVIWKILFTPPVSILNYLVTTLGFNQLAWLGDSKLALVAIAVAQVWEFFPFCFLLYYAALMSLPSEPFEAAEVDGASFWQSLRYITLPMLGPTLSIVFLFRLVDSLKAFPLIYGMTEGGPGFVTEPPNYYAFVEAFSYSQIGYSSSMIVILFSLSLVLTFLVMRNVQWKRGEI
jgi:multiple sugar transport system permease protein